LLELSPMRRFQNVSCIHPLLHPTETNVFFFEVVGKSIKDSNISLDVGRKYPLPLQYQLLLIFNADVDTTSVWIALLESGCSLIAVNLPALGSLVHNLSLSSILTSLRTMVYRKSTNSDSEISHEGVARNAPYIRTNSLSNQDNIEMVPKHKQMGWYTAINRSIDSSLEDGGTRQEIKDRIHVQKTVDQTSITKAG
jgi:hypothetical protein